MLINSTITHSTQSNLLGGVLMNNTWKEKLPFLYQEYKKGLVHRFDATGVSLELTEAQKKKIKELEAKFENHKVITCLDANYRFSDGMIFNFINYLLLSEDEDEQPELYDDDSEIVLFLAYVDNITAPDCSELGNIGVIERSGLLKRVF
jgi:hypothetical protein